MRVRERKLRRRRGRREECMEDVHVSRAMWHERGCMRVGREGTEEPRNDDDTTDKPALATSRERERVRDYLLIAVPTNLPTHADRSRLNACLKVFTALTSQSPMVPHFNIAFTWFSFTPCTQSHDASMNLALSRGAAPTKSCRPPPPLRSMRARVAAVFARGRWRCLGANHLDDWPIRERRSRCARLDDTAPLPQHIQPPPLRRIASAAWTAKIACAATTCCAAAANELGGEEGGEVPPELPPLACIGEKVSADTGVHLCVACLNDAVGGGGEGGGRVYYTVRHYG